MTFSCRGSTAAEKTHNGEHTALEGRSQYCKAEKNISCQNSWNKTATLSSAFKDIKHSCWRDMNC